MRDPGAVESVAGLPALVLAHLLERQRGHLGVAPVRDERAHAADRVGAALVAGAHQELGVGAHERHGHRDLLAVGQDVPAAPAAVVLDDAEDVVPAAGVQARAVVAQLVEDLVHLEGGRDRLDEHGGPDGAVRQAQVLLGEGEHVVPQPGFLVGFDLRQVEVGTAALRDERCGVVEEVQPEVDQAPGCRDAGAGAVDEVQVLLHQVPAAGAHHDGRGRALAHRVDLAVVAGVLRGCRARRRTGSAGRRSRCPRWGWWRPPGRRATRSRRSSAR